MSGKSATARRETTPSTRQRVVRAARKLMQAEGTSFSMRALADQAGVSIATPYNLFKSKDGIISAVVDEDLRHLQKALLEIEAGPIDAFFKIIDVTAEMFAEAPVLYKAGARLVGSQADAGTHEKRQRSFHQPRFLVLKALVAQAVQDGAIQHKVNLDSFTIHIGQQILSWILVWGNDRIELEEMRLRTNYAVAVALAGVATDGTRAELLDRAFGYQDELQKIEKRLLAQTGKQAK